MGKSIFDIDREFLDIFEELEENGGELTPEIEEKLKLNEEEVISKVKNYVEFALVDNRNKSTRVLLNRDVLSKMAYMIDPGRKHTIDNIPAKIK